MTEIANEKKGIPVVALRGMCVLPGAMVHFDIERPITMKAIEAALAGDQMIFVTVQKKEEDEIPGQEELEHIGCVALVKQMVKLPGDILRIMILGIERAVLGNITNTVPYLAGDISFYEDHSMDLVSDLEKKAMMRNLVDLVKEYSSEEGNIGKNALKKILDITQLDKMTEEVALNLPLTLEGRQQLLNQLEAAGRYEYVSIVLAEEIELLRIKREFQIKVKAQVDKNQREYLLREQLKVIREELGETTVEDDAQQYLDKLGELQAAERIKEKIKREIERFKNIASSASESGVIRGYIETLLALPWDRVSKDNNDIRHAQKILDAEHYGLKKVKTRILEFLAVRTLTGKGESPIICLVGPPGTGKTSIAKSVAKAMNKEYIRICLGGVRDEAEIRGHRRTYVGALPGRIISGLKSAGVKNPLMLLDEVDKVGKDQRGDTASALLEVLDSEQNQRFVDHYIELPVDLSEVLFIATANSTQTIPKPLLDRMEIIEVSSYTENEKYHIGKQYLIPKQKEKNGLGDRKMTISGKALEEIITGYTREAGVRNLERKIGEICRKAARELLEEEKKQIKVTDKNLELYLGKVLYTIDEANEKDDVGIVRGLAWTSVGGDTLQIEVNIMPGKGSFELTGQMGDVMKESAKAGISYIRSKSKDFGIQKDFFEKHDIHIHIPEGAVPKDGPSAGITMATAMLSAITNQKVRARIAMTGEITLRGRVLPVGGLKEKVLAAKTAKIHTVLVPKKNRKDIEEIEKEILDGIHIKYVETMDEVLTEAFL